MPPAEACVSVPDQSPGTQQAETPTAETQVDFMARWSKTRGRRPWNPGDGGLLAHPSVCFPRYRVVVSYPPQSEAEIELKEGDVVFVHKKREDGWYKGTLQRNGRTGLFPGSFVESF